MNEEITLIFTAKSIVVFEMHVSTQTKQTATTFI